MTIIRGPRAETGWTPARDAAIWDRPLANQALGLPVRLLAPPEGASTNTVELARRGPDGADAIKASMRRLQTRGYVRRVRRRTPEGTWKTDTYVYDSPGDAIAHAQAVEGETAGH